MLVSIELDGSVLVAIYLSHYVMRCVLVLILLTLACRIPSEGADEK